MSEQRILDFFYQTVVPAAASSQPIFIDGWKFFVDFDTRVLDDNINRYSPENTQGGVTLLIKDKERFNAVLVEYCLKMIEHINKHEELQQIDYLYFAGDVDSMLQAVLLNVWFNATEEDFNDPIHFLYQRVDFLDNEFCNENLRTKFMSAEIERLGMNQLEAYVDIQNPSALETPYVFCSHIKSCQSPDEIYELPNISFGISNNVSYVYAIQGVHKTSFTPYQKKINRLLYKANENFVNDYEEESIKDVSVSQLFAFTAFLKMMQELGIEDIVVKNFYPLRYQAKERVIQSKISQLESRRGGLDNEGDINWHQEIETLKSKNDSLQYNIHNKYLRIFRRIEYHFPNVEVSSYPYELDNAMHLKIDSNADFTNTVSSNVLNDVYQSFTICRDMDHKKL